MKKVQFDYEYFKKNPETKLETRGGDEVRFIGNNSMCLIENCQLVFGTKKNVITTTIDGFYVNNKSVCKVDISMLVESKETVRYYNVYPDYLGCVYSTLDEAINNSPLDTKSAAKSVAKLTIVDGEITKCETVHKY